MLAQIVHRVVDGNFRSHGLQVNITATEIPERDSVFFLEVEDCLEATINSHRALMTSFDTDVNDEAYDFLQNLRSFIVSKFQSFASESSRVNMDVANSSEVTIFVYSIPEKNQVKFVEFWKKLRELDTPAFLNTCIMLYHNKETPEPKMFTEILETADNSLRPRRKVSKL